MKRLVTFVILLAACAGMYAKQMKGKVVSETDHRPVANATLQVEYVDTIITYEADRKGRFNIDPLSFPVTITTRGAGMQEGLIGLMSMPDSKLIITLTPDPKAALAGSVRILNGTTALSRRISSKFIIRSSESKK